MGKKTKNEETDLQKQKRSGWRKTSNGEHGDLRWPPMTRLVLERKTGTEEVSPPCKENTRKGKTPTGLSNIRETWRNFCLFLHKTDPCPVGGELAGDR